MSRRKSCGLRGVESRGLDLPCQGEGCGRAFSNPMGLAAHRCAICSAVKLIIYNIPTRKKYIALLALVQDGLNLVCRRSCKKLPALAVGDNSTSNEELGPGGEGLRDRERRSRSRRKIEVRGKIGEGMRDEERSRSGKGVAQNGNDKWVGEDSKSPADGSRSPKSPKKRDCTDDLKVEMEVLMRLRDGKMVSTKYRVGNQALMQSVIIKVGQGAPLSVGLYFTQEALSQSSIGWPCFVFPYYS